MNPKPGNIGIDRQSLYYKNMQYLLCWYFVYFTFNIYINTWFNTIAKCYPLKFNGGSVNVNFSVKEFTGNVQFWWHPWINCLCPNAKDTVLHTCSQNCLNGLVSSWTWWSTTWCDLTNDDCLIIAHSGINFSEIVIKKHSFSFRKIHFKKSSAIFLRSQCIKYLVITLPNGISPIEGSWHFMRHFSNVTEVSWSIRFRENAIIKVIYWCNWERSLLYNTMGLFQLFKKVRRYI